MIIQELRVAAKHIADSSKYKYFEIAIDSMGYLKLTWCDPDKPDEKMVMHLDPNETKKLIYFFRDLEKLSGVK